MAHEHAPGSELPLALERALAAAAVDNAFREHLLRDRRGALAARGLELSAAELALLEAVPAAQLRELLARLATASIARPAGVDIDGGGHPVPVGIRPDRELVKGIRPGRLLLTAVAATAVAGGAGALIVSAGVRADRPEQHLQQPAAHAPDASAARGLTAPDTGTTDGGAAADGDG